MMKIQNVKGTPIKEIITHFLKGGFERRLEALLGEQGRNQTFCK